MELATELGLMEGAIEQIVDSTPMLGAAVTQDTVTLVRSGVAKLLGAVREADEAAAAALGRGLEFDYRAPREKPDCDWREKDEREAMLTRVAQDAERALRAVEAAPQLLAEEAVERARGLLRELIGQDFDVDPDGVPRLHRGTRAGRVLSVHDTEMRHGRKSSSRRFDGYKLHATVTNAEQPLITAVEVTAASEHDGPQAKALIDSQPEGRRPRRVLGDTAYGNQEVREEMEDRGVGRECRARPLEPQCTKAGRRRVSIGRREDLMIAARQALDYAETAEHLRRTRPRIERLLGLAAHRYGARKSRYRGRRKATLQAAWGSAVVNLNPIGAALRAAAA